jgi:hypothetical protein
MTTANGASLTAANWWRVYYDWLVIVYRTRGSGKWGGLFRPREDEDAKPRFMIGAYSNPLAAQRTVMRELQEHLADEARIRRIREARGALAQ